MTEPVRIFQLPTDERIPIRVSTPSGAQVNNRIQIDNTIIDVCGAGPGLVIGRVVETLTEGECQG